MPRNFATHTNLLPTNIMLFRKIKIALLQKAKEHDRLASENEKILKHKRAAEYRAIAMSCDAAKKDIEQIEEKLKAIAFGQFDDDQNAFEHCQQLAAECLAIASRS